MSFHIFFLLSPKGSCTHSQELQNNVVPASFWSRSSKKKKTITLKVEEKNTSFSLLYQRIGEIWVSNIFLRSSCTNFNVDNEEFLRFNRFDTSLCPHPFRNNKFLKCECSCPKQTFSAYHFYVTEVMYVFLNKKLKQFRDI